MAKLENLCIKFYAYCTIFYRSSKAVLQFIDPPGPLLLSLYFT